MWCTRITEQLTKSGTNAGMAWISYIVNVNGSIYYYRMNIDIYLNMYVAGSLHNSRGLIRSHTTQLGESRVYFEISETAL